MSDNLRRGARTAIQGIVGFLGAGGLSLIWQNYISNHDAKFDPTVLFVVTIALTGIASWAQNAFEDATGTGVLLPKDRKLGDEALNTGVGAKQAKS